MAVQEPKGPVANPYTTAPSPTWAPASPVNEASPVKEAPAPEPVEVSTVDADPTNVTYEQAMAYAMSAQYMAGYWMGVAHTKKNLPEEAANLFVTSHRSS